MKRDREGNFERVEPLRNETNDVYSYRRTKLDRKEIPAEQRNSGFETREATSPAQSMQRREYQPSQLTTAFEGQESTRTYQRIPQESPRITRDRYEAPPLERAPANRETQQQSETQPRQWRQVENQNPVRQERSVHPNYERNSSVNSSRTRTSISQSPPAEIRKRESADVNEQPSRATHGHSGFRKRNSINFRSLVVSTCTTS